MENRWLNASEKPVGFTLASIISVILAILWTEYILFEDSKIDILKDFSHDTFLNTGLYLYVLLALCHAFAAYGLLKGRYWSWFLTFIGFGSNIVIGIIIITRYRMFDDVPFFLWIMILSVFPLIYIVNMRNRFRRLTM